MPLYSEGPQMMICELIAVGTRDESSGASNLTREQLGLNMYSWLDESMIWRERGYWRQGSGYPHLPA
jgi:hypothetical protein